MHFQCELRAEYDLFELMIAVACESLNLAVTRNNVGQVLVHLRVET
jgi:hypothetical protein